MAGVAARITLRVNSTLEEIGLTVAVSRVLADAGISCSVIAGAAHGHLLVDWPRRNRALDLLGAGFLPGSQMVVLRIPCGRLSGGN